MSSAVTQGPLLAPSIATTTSTEQSTSERKQDNYEEAGEPCGGGSGGGATGYAVDQQSWASKMNGMMKELYESRKEDVHSEAMDAEILQNGNESETKYPPRSLTSPSGNSLSNGNGLMSSEECIHDISSPLSRHHRLGMMRGDTLSQETSKLLREILQNKEKRLQQKLSNGGSVPGLLNSINDDRTFFTKFLHREGAMYGNGELEVDNSSVHSGTPADCLSSASEDSDQENNGSNVINGVSQKSSIKYSGMNNNNNGNSKPPHSPAELDNQNEDSNTTTNTETGDSVQAKRARVENIITNMRLSPSRAPLDIAGGMLQEVRRQKRKQYQPQQMDSRGDGQEHSAPKQRKMEKETLRSQLKHMQQQLLQMQQRYMSLYERESVSDHSDMSEASDSEGKPEVCDNNNVVSSGNKHMHNNRDSEKSKLGFENKNCELSNINRLNFSKHAPSDKKSSLSRHPKLPVEAQDLAKALKEEIASSIGGLVDSIVAKIMSPKKREDTVPLTVPVREPKEEKHKPGPLSENKETKDKEHDLHKSIRTKVTDKILPMESPHKLFHDLHRPHPHIYAPPPYFPTQVHAPPPALFPTQPEQTEALSLVVSTPKKKRTKVTDTRLSPRAARALLQETPTQHHASELEKHHMQAAAAAAAAADHYHHGLVPVTLPTSVAIPNPSLQHSDVLAMYTHGDHHGPYGESLRSTTHSPSTGDHISPSMGHTPMDSMSMSVFKSDQDSHENSIDSPIYDGSPMVSFLKAFNNVYQLTSTLTPMHLRKAKLMFFFVRYPSSAILKVYFPDIKFNKNNTAQLVKWFSNFREFYYIQMEKYSRQAIAEGVKNVDDLVVTVDSELYRVLNLHYNRNNQIEVPDNFRGVVQVTLREFFKAITAGKDQEQSWKKAIYKVIARLDDALPEFFKHSNWMEQLSDA